MNTFLFIVIVCLQAIDAWTTWRILGAGGRESNPVLRAIMLSIGVRPALLLVKFAVIVIARIWLIGSVLLMLPVVLVYLVIVAHNLRQMYDREGGA